MQKANTVKRRGSVVRLCTVRESFSRITACGIVGWREMNATDATDRPAHRVIIARARVEQANAALRVADNVSFLLHTAARVEAARSDWGKFSKDTGKPRSANQQEGMAALSPQSPQHRRPTTHRTATAIITTIKNKKRGILKHGALSNGVTRLSSSTSIGPTVA